MASKYIQLADALRKEIPQYTQSGNHRLPTEMELMKKYSVSRQTVRQALSLLLSEGLIEKRQGSGTFIAQTAAASLSSRKLAILTSLAGERIFPSALWEIQSTFSAAGYQSQFFSTGNRTGLEREILQILLEHPVRGILVKGTRTAYPNPNIDLYRQLQKNGTKLLFIESTYPELSDVPCVRTDDYAGGYLLAQYLIKQGHTKIAGIFRSDELCSHERFRGMISAIRDHALPFDDRHILWYDPLWPGSIIGSPDPELMRTFIHMQLAGCTAVICQNGEVADFLIRGLLRLEISVPHQISVVGFGSSHSGFLHPVPITSVATKNSALWTSVAQGLLQLVEDKPFTPPLYPWTLIERDSVRKLSPDA